MFNLSNKKISKRRNGEIAAYTQPTNSVRSAAVSRPRHVETASSGSTTLMSSAAAANTNVAEGYLTGMVAEDSPLLLDAYRDMYYNDSICGSAVDLWSELPFSDFQLFGLPEDQLEVYRSAIARLNIRSACSQMTRQYLVDGSYTATLVFDNKTTQFTDQIPYATEDLTFDDSPLFSQDPVITAKIGKRFDKFLNETTPEWQNLRKSVPAKLLEALKSGEFVLDPLSTIYLARRTMATQPAVSYLKRCLPIYMLEKVLYRGTLFELSRRQRANVLVTAGDDMWEPTVDELSALANLFQQSDLDPMGALIVTRNSVNVSEFRSGGDFVKWTDVYDQTTSMKLKALGISDAFLSSDSCLPGDALVPTSRGLLRMDEIIPNATTLEKDVHVSVSMGAKSRYGKHGQIKSGLFNGVRNTIRVGLSNGSAIKATGNHPILVFDGISTNWKRTDQLEIGDVVCYDTTSIETSHRLLLNIPSPTYKPHTKPSYMNKVLRPNEMTEGLAYLLGALFADGWISKKQVGFSNTNKEMCDKVVSLISKYFGVKMTVTYKEGSTYDIYGVTGETLPHWHTVQTSKDLSEALDYLGFTIHNAGSKNCSMRDLPWSIRQANTSCQQAFLAGYLDGDGNISHGKCSLLSTSEKLRNGIYNLLASLGVYSIIDGRAVHVSSTEDRQRLFDMVRPYCVKDVPTIDYSDSFKTHCIPVSGYFNVIKNRIVGSNRYGYILDDSSVISANKLSHKYGVNIQGMVNGKIKTCPYNKRMAKGVYKFLSFFDAELAKEFKRSWKSKYVYLKVTSLEDCGKERVYDISMVDEPAFVAQGIVVHNTYNNAEQAVAVFMDNISAYRSFFTHTVFENKLFPLIAMAKGFVKDTEKNVEKANLSIKTVNDYSTLAIPKVRWSKRLSANNDENLMASLEALTEKGVPVPMRLWIAAAGLDANMLLTELEDDAELKSKLEQLGATEDDEMDIELSSLSPLSKKSKGFKELVESGILSDAVRIGGDGKVHNVINQSKAHKAINENIVKAVSANKEKGK